MLIFLETGIQVIKKKIAGYKKLSILRNKRLGEREREREKKIKHKSLVTKRRIKGSG